MERERRRKKKRRGRGGGGGVLGLEGHEERVSFRVVLAGASLSLFLFSAPVATSWRWQWFVRSLRHDRVKLLSGCKLLLLILGERGREFD